MLFRSPTAPGIWIANTLGELGLFYRLAGHAFIGRSLVPLGGQNPIEPARLGCAIAVGPHIFNFPEAVEVLHTAGALTRVADAAALTGWVADMLTNPARAAAMGAAGQAAVRGLENLPTRIAGLLTELAHARP